MSDAREELRNRTPPNSDLSYDTDASSTGVANQLAPQLNLLDEAEQQIVELQDRQARFACARALHLHVSDTDAPLVDALHRVQWIANRPIGSWIFKPVQLHFLPACTSPIFPPLPCTQLTGFDSTTTGAVHDVPAPLSSQQLPEMPPDRIADMLSSAAVLAGQLAGVQEREASDDDDDDGDGEDDMDEEGTDDDELLSELGAITQDTDLEAGAAQYLRVILLTDPCYSAHKIPFLHAVPAESLQILTIRACSIGDV